MKQDINSQLINSNGNLTRVVSSFLYCALQPAPVNVWLNFCSGEKISPVGDFKSVNPN